MPLHVAYVIAATCYWGRCNCLLKRLCKISRNTHLHTHYCLYMMAVALAEALCAQIYYTWICVCQSVPPLFWFLQIVNYWILIEYDWYCVLYQIDKISVLSWKTLILEFKTYFCLLTLNWMESLVKDKICVDVRVSYVTVLLKLSITRSTLKHVCVSLFFKLRD